MNNVQKLRRCAGALVERLRGALQLLAFTAMLAGICILLADHEAPSRWLGLFADLV